MITNVFVEDVDGEANVSSLINVVVVAWQETQRHTTCCQDLFLRVPSSSVTATTTMAAMLLRFDVKPPPRGVLWGNQFHSLPNIHPFRPHRPAVVDKEPSVQQLRK